MTNPSCETCGGKGYINKIIGESRLGEPIWEPSGGMIICDAINPSDDRTPPHLRGQPCTPRTKFRSPIAPMTNRYGAFDHRPVATPSDKRRETREHNAKLRAAEKANEPTKGRRR